MMEPSKSLRLLEVILADAVSKEIQMIRNDICCGCKVYNQDCLMMTDHETWHIHGVKAIERISQQTNVWNKFVDVMKVLNRKIHSNLANHLSWLLADPNEDLIRDLLQIYEDNSKVLDTINKIIHYPYVQCYFSCPPSYKYYIKQTNEQFNSNEENSVKAYYEYLKSKLCEQLNKLK